MDIILERKYYKNGVNGEMSMNGKFIGFTIELPWRENQKRISCIPEGKYQLRRRFTTKFGWHLAVMNVPFRDAILIHAFNNAIKESKGCIAPVSAIIGEGIGTSSRLALARLVSLLSPMLESEKVYLIIKSTSHEDNFKKSTTVNSQVF